jgi:integrase
MASRNPISADIKPPIGANRVANKAAFTDDELARIIDACDRLGEVVWSNGRKQGAWTSEDMKDFIWVMVYTGLRMSDVDS